MKSSIITPSENYKAFDEWITDQKIEKTLLVCGHSIRFQTKFLSHLDEVKKNIPIYVFGDFQPNPLYENIVKGVKAYRENNCDSIIAVGGGSAIDVAKCIKLFSTADGNGEEGTWLQKKIDPPHIPFLAFPTTAGSGSEATRYAVIYYQGQKQSISNEDLIPDVVLMDPDALIYLPLYQKKATAMDAFSHAIESYWSINSTQESRNISLKTIQLIRDNLIPYLDNNQQARANMLLASNLAGKAINVTQTTAGHAMCYKITSLFGISHGQAAFLCNINLFEWMISNMEMCVDRRGKDYLYSVFMDISKTLGCNTLNEASAKLHELYNYLGFSIPIASDRQFKELRESVNPVRMKNHPTVIDKKTIDMLYHKILKGSINES